MELNPSGVGEKPFSARAPRLRGHVPLTRGFAGSASTIRFPPRKEDPRGNAFSPRLFATFPANGINSEASALLPKCMNNENKGC